MVGLLLWLLTTKARFSDKWSVATTPAGRECLDLFLTLNRLDRDGERVDPSISPFRPREKSIVAFLARKGSAVGPFR